MSNLVNFAKDEFARIPLPEDSEIDIAMRNHIIHMIDEFSKEDHSGFSANYAISLLTRLLSFKPLTPLTGEDDEWVDVGDDTLQNKRYSAVFKNTKTGKSYNIEGKVFWEWYVDKETGERFKSYYTCRESRIDVEFPYVVPSEPIYEERNSNEE